MSLQFIINDELRLAKRRIKRAKPKLERLQKMKEGGNLSVYGYQELSYFQEHISCNEDLIYLLERLLEEEMECKEIG